LYVTLCRMVHRLQPFRGVFVGTKAANYFASVLQYPQDLVS